MTSLAADDSSVAATLRQTSIYQFAGVDSICPSSVVGRWTWRRPLQTVAVLSCNLTTPTREHSNGTCQQSTHSNRAMSDISGRSPPITIPTQHRCDRCPEHARWPRSSNRRATRSTRPNRAPINPSMTSDANAATRTGKPQDRSCSSEMAFATRNIRNRESQVKP